jgi:phosphate/sulfate permease
MRYRVSHLLGLTAAVAVAVAVFPLVMPSEVSTIVVLWCGAIFSPLIAFALSCGLYFVIRRCSDGDGDDSE